MNNWYDDKTCIYNDNFVCDYPDCEDCPVKPVKKVVQSTEQISIEEYLNEKNKY